jgi:hypothetical protein
MRRTCIALAALLLSAAGLHAEDAPAPDGPIDLRAALGAMHEEIGTLAQEPEFKGIEGRLVKTWKTYVKPRVPGIQRAFRGLMEERRFHINAADGYLIGVKPDAWNGMVAQLTKAYSSLASARAGYDKLNVSPDSSIRRWERANRAPRLTGYTPSEARAASLLAQIRHYRARRMHVPPYLILQHERYLELAALERLRLEEAYAEWVRAQEGAIQRIQEHARETQAVAELQQQRFTLLMQNLQVISAALMEIDEGTLLHRLEGLGPDAPVQEQGRELLQELASGRRQVATYDTSKSSRWSSLLRQKWLVPRNKLAGLLARAERDLAEADPVTTPAPVPVPVPETGPGSAK